MLSVAPRSPSLQKRAVFRSPSRIFHLTVSVALSILTFAAPRAQADQGPIARRSVPQAQVDPRPVRLPVTDAKDIRFKRLSTEDGLSQTRVLQIVQDDQGFMWFGTQYGLNRYDGYTFKVFKHDSERENSLSGVYIHSLFKDRSGALWIGCDEFVDKFDPVTETFTHYRLDTQDPTGRSVVHISQDGAGILWLATNRGLYRLDPATGAIAHHRHDPNDASSLSSNDIKSTGEDRTGTLWVANGNSLDAFDREAGKVTLRVPLHEPVRELSFHEDRFGVLLDRL